MLPIPNPVAFSLFGLDIRWYAITMVLGIFLGLLVAMLRIKKFDLSEDNFLDYFLWVVPISLIGARAYYVFFEFNYYKYNPEEILNLRNGGLAIHGAIFAGLIVTFIYCYYKKYNFLKFLDLLAPSLALGQAIGRWGNYFNMEAHGRITDLPWAIPVYDLANEVIYVHPTFLYESICDFLIFLFLIYYEDHWEKKCGEAACLYLMFYSFARFFIEGLRTDSLLFYGLRTAQIVSIILFIIGLVGFFYLKKRGKNFVLLTKEEVSEIKLNEKKEKEVIKAAKKNKTFKRPETLNRNKNKNSK